MKNIYIYLIIQYIFIFTMTIQTNYIFPLFRIKNNQEIKREITDTIYIDGGILTEQQFYVQIGIGSLPQYFNVVLDTGFFNHKISS